MSLATPEKLRKLPRKLYLKAKQEMGVRRLRGVRLGRHLRQR